PRWEPHWLPPWWAGRNPASSETPSSSSKPDKPGRATPTRTGQERGAQESSRASPRIRQCVFPIDNRSKGHPYFAGTGGLRGIAISGDHASSVHIEALVLFSFDICPLASREARCR